jgi:hypothetical protein
LQPFWPDHLARQQDLIRHLPEGQAEFWQILDWSGVLGR